MHKYSGERGNPTALAERDYPHLERQTLVLDALLKLTRQFSKKPEFQHIVNVLLMTLCGQFSTGDSFAILCKPGLPGAEPSVFSTGRFRKAMALETVNKILSTYSELFDDPAACIIKEGDVLNERCRAIPALIEPRVNVLCPLVHNGSAFGIVGLGRRLNKRAYDQKDMDLLSAILTTITPFLATSYLVWEIGTLNSRYLDVFNSVRLGVYVFGRNRRLKKINQTGLEILKTFNPQISEVNSLYSISIHEVFPSGIFNDLASEPEAEKPGQSSKLIKTIVARSKGIERIYNAHFSEGSQGAEGGAHLVITLDDVTTQKRTDRRISELQSLADRGVMVASMSHELNNLLALVLGGVEIVQFALRNGATSKAGVAIERLNKSVMRMRRFTANLVDSSMAETDREIGDLNAMILDVLSFVLGQERFNGITVVPEFDCNLPLFMMNADQVTQILLNLLNNAADSIREAERIDGRIDVRTLYQKGCAVFSVSDNGVGIEPEVKESLFKSHLTTKKNGHGYGLMTCADFLHSHNATTSIDSQVGEGATFTIIFPVVTLE